MTIGKADLTVEKAVFYQPPKGNFSKDVAHGDLSPEWGKKLESLAKEHYHARKASAAAYKDLQQEVGVWSEGYSEETYVNFILARTTEFNTRKRMIRFASMVDGIEYTGGPDICE
jgi:hypothetical protein